MMRQICVRFASDYTAEKNCDSERRLAETTGLAPSTETVGWVVGF